MRKGLLLVAVLALGLLFAGSAFAAGEIKVGYLTALTGDYAGYGQTA